MSITWDDLVEAEDADAEEEAPRTRQPRPRSEAPRSAYEAADRLLHDGHHVHLVAEGESICYSRHCPPGLLQVAGRPLTADLLGRY